MHGDDGIALHSSDVVLTRPKAIHDLSIGDVVLLPLWGRSKVMSVPTILPGSNRMIVVLIVSCEKGIKRLLCERNMSFQYEGYCAD